MKHKTITLIASLTVVLMFQGWLIRIHTPDSAILPPSGLAQNTDMDTGGMRSTQWIYSTWMPDSIERKFYHIFMVRRGAILNGGNTVVDTDVPLDSVSAFVKYIPRALQLGLLSPTPEYWGGQGSTRAMTMARKVMGVVMPVFYISLLGMFIGIIKFRNNINLWVVLLFCMLGVMVYVYAYPNIGTLMRYRYVFYMTLISFGLAAIVELVKDNWRKYAASTDAGLNESKAHTKK